MRAYHIGLVKQGNTVILEVADTVDALSCETWKYLGERQNTLKNIRKNNGNVLNGLNAGMGTSFTKLVVRRVPSWDLSAGH